MINQNSNNFSIRNSRNGSAKIDLLGAFGLKSVRLSLVQLRAQINKKTQIDGWGYLISFARKITLCPLFCLKYRVPFLPNLSLPERSAHSTEMFIQVVHIRSAVMPQPLGKLRSFSPTDNCHCLDSNLPRNASHRWRERERQRNGAREREIGGWIRQDDSSFWPFQPGILKISSVGWCVPSDMLLAPPECKYTPPGGGYGARVSLSAAQTARGSYRSIVRTRQGALFPLLLPGADFHPRWAGGRLDSLLVWHSLDDLGGMDGRHTAIHGHITGNRKAVLLHRYFPVNPLSLSLWQKECLG